MSETYPELHRPRLKAHLAVRVVAPDEVFLLAEDDHHLVRGEAAVAVVPLLDGTRTVPEIVAAVADRTSLPERLLAGHPPDGSAVIDCRRRTNCGLRRDSKHPWNDHFSSSTRGFPTRRGPGS